MQSSAASQWWAGSPSLEDLELVWILTRRWHQPATTCARLSSIWFPNSLFITWTFDRAEEKNKTKKQSSETANNFLFPQTFVRLPAESRISVIWLLIRNVIWALRNQIKHNRVYVTSSLWWQSERINLLQLMNNGLRDCQGNLNPKTLEMSSHPRFCWKHTIE